MKIAFRHLHSSLQSSWNYAQLGLLLLPLSPLLGIVGLGLLILVTGIAQRRIIIRRRVNWGFALLGVMLIVTAAFAYDKTAAILGLFNFLPFFLFFASFSILIQSVAQLRQLSWILVITSVPVVIIGFGQLFWGWATSQQWEGVFGWAIAPGGNPPHRMASIFMYANTLALYLLIVFILGLGLWLEAFRGDRGDRGVISSSSSSSSYLRVFFLSVVMVANFVALILTDSRNAWVIAILACLAYAIYQGWRILVAGVVGVATSVLLAAFAPSPIAQLFRQVVPAFFWARLNDQLYPDRPVALLRKTQWQFAWSLAVQRPFTGWGLRNFTQLYEARVHIWLGHPHNLFLMLGAETGIPTTLLFCGLVCWIFIGGVQLLRKSELLATEDKLIFFSYLVVFVGWVLFNTVDVSLYDLRLNALSWLLLSAIYGVVDRYKQKDRLAANQT